MLQINTIEQSIDDIAACLALPANQLQGFGYSGGLLGKVLFFYYYAAHTQDETYADWAAKILRKAIANVSAPYQGRNYYKEVAEFGTFLEYMAANNLLDADLNALLSGTDILQAEGIAASLRDNNFDPNNGALAGGLYFLARTGSSEAARAHLEHLALALAGLAVKDPAGNLFWQSRLFGLDRVYLGLSHGSAIIVLYLCRMCELGILPDLCRETIRKAVDYVRSQRQDCRQAGYCFPNIVGEAPAKTRLGLCYGDLGVAYSLYRAAGVLGDDRLAREALAIVDHSTGRSSPEDSLVGDAGILYGAAGVALLFDKMYELTQRPAYDQAAGEWYERIPAYATRDNATAGYHSVFNQHFSHTNVGFMEGIAGIGCTLIKYTQRDNYSFDNLIWLL